jgi:hypothetical protein
MMEIPPLPRRAARGSLMVRPILKTTRGRTAKTRRSEPPRYQGFAGALSVIVPLHPWPIVAHLLHQVSRRTCCAISAAADAVIGTLATLLPLRRDIHTNSLIFADTSGKQNAGLPVAKTNILDYIALFRDVRPSRTTHSALPEGVGEFATNTCSAALRPVSDGPSKHRQTDERCRGLRLIRSAQRTGGEQGDSQSFVV